MSKMTVSRALKLARVSAAKGDMAKARRLYETVIRQMPGNAEAKQGLAQLGGAGATGQPGPDRDNLFKISELLARRQFDDVKRQCAALLQRFPKSPEVWFLLGSAESYVGNPKAAVDALLQAIKHKPDYALAYQVLGSVFETLERFADATKAYGAAIQHNPGLAKAHSGLGDVKVRSEELEEAVAHYSQCLELQPDNEFVLLQKLVWQGHMCKWQAFEEFAGVASQLGLGRQAVGPFGALAFEDNPERHAERAKVYARSRFGTPAPPLQPYAKAPGERIRLGYFSADFRNHPMLYLMSGLLREHDRDRFEIYAFSYGVPDEGELLNEAKRHIDHFIDVHLAPNDEIVALARKHRIDIAIDRKGYTANTRSALFAKRLAPVQINYLAYPGTMGTDFMDYIIADPVVAPEDQDHAFSEKVLRLPHCYQPNDERRPIAQGNTTRAEFGLPEDGVVFCCFNQNYKIEPRLFEIWMRLLGKVEGSVLWLLDWNRWGTEALSQHASDHGIDPARIVFGEKLPHEQHLARLRNADLFLDTFNYGAHTTASDALWAGVPVVTKAGRQFAARVGASLLTAVGLPELITYNEADYEALILDLATNPEKLAAVREKLARNRTTEPLFDTKRYARDFEQALLSTLETPGVDRKETT